MTQKEKAEQFDLIRRIVAAVDVDDLFWTADGERLSISVNCDDLFYWATCDCEPITPQNIDVLEQAVMDGGRYHAATLFACRVRGMRPQSPVYKSISPELHPLFDACGPSRSPKSKG